LPRQYSSSPRLSVREDGGTLLTTSSASNSSHSMMTAHRHVHFQQSCCMVQGLPQQQQTQPTGASWLALPNLLSLSRVAAGPWVAYLIASQQWPLAAAVTAAAGVGAKSCALNSSQHVVCATAG
jgi:hypothetical protein